MICAYSFSNGNLLCIEFCLIKDAVSYLSNLDLLGSVDFLLEFFAVAEWVVHIVVNDALEPLVFSQMLLVVAQS